VARVANGSNGEGVGVPMGFSVANACLELGLKVVLFRASQQRPPPARAEATVHTTQLLMANMNTNVSMFE
jgi:hypothetical protein